MKKRLLQEGHLASCYFRSSVEHPHRKALIQITERCNLHCAHCFVSAGSFGEDMSVNAIRDVLIPKLLDCRVVSVTLTGGEPFVHPDILDIVSQFSRAKIKVSICTNATTIDQNMVDFLVDIGGVHCNVSLDGFSADTHGLFRGNRDSFALTIANIALLAENGLLHGLLVTPNNLSNIEEYVEICEFAKQHKASYVLMNPLSFFGRGVKSVDKFGAALDQMRSIKGLTSSFGNKLDMLYVRFPNDAKLPLLGCEAGNIIYIFTNGSVTVCPYLTFAARTSVSLYSPQEFIVGNVFQGEDLTYNLDNYSIYQGISHTDCLGCELQFVCGKGCPAAVIAAGKRIGSIDAGVCPCC